MQSSLSMLDVPVSTRSLLAFLAGSELNLRSFEPLGHAISIFGYIEHAYDGTAEYGLGESDRFMK
jgi:hypothetical protein